MLSYNDWTLLPVDFCCPSWFFCFLYLLIVESEGTVSSVQSPSLTSFFRICGALKAGSYCWICLITSGEVPLVPDLARTGVCCDPLVGGIPMYVSRAIEPKSRSAKYSYTCNHAEWLHIKLKCVVWMCTKNYHSSYNWEYVKIDLLTRYPIKVVHL